VLRVPGTDQVMYMMQTSFIEGAIEGNDIFRLSHRGSLTYVSERFVDRVTAAGLVGLVFKSVWSSE
jgi:hypothetical protein